MYTDEKLRLNIITWLCQRKKVIMSSRRLEIGQKIIRDKAIFIQLNDAIFGVSKAYFCYDAR